MIGTAWKVRESHYNPPKKKTGMMEQWNGVKPNTESWNWKILTLYF
jgi:hypothetical protein